MSQYYNPRRMRNIYNPSSKEPFRLSRSKIDQFLNCPRCFYLDRRLGISQPPGFPFALNSAVDLLLKKEFDIHRAKGDAHPLMENYGIEAVPFEHEKMDEWRDALRGGITHLHKPTNFFITGGIDDIWKNKDGELIIVDYKATAKDGDVGIDAEWQIAYKRQMEIYQWLFRKNGFPVSKTGYFVYCNGKLDKEAFDGKLEFVVKLIPYDGDDSWVEQVLMNAKKCLDGNSIPSANPNCDFCAYRKAVREVHSHE